LTKREASGWSKPEKLHDYINTPERTTTQPFVVHDRDIEYLFFASDRDGGEGGMDIWYAQRVLDGSEDIDFSYPQNAGPKINTLGDEITPFFDPNTQTLYFSSNAHVSLGGFDVQKSVRSAGKWTQPENMGIPYNSNGDDFSFSLKKSGNGGFLVSNRLFGNEKISTRDEDIFEFSPKMTRLKIAGVVLDAATGLQLTNSEISLYEMIPGQESRLLQVRPSANGSFEFPVHSDKKYWLEVTREGYESANFKAGMDESGESLGYQIEFRLNPETVGQIAKKENTTASLSLDYTENKSSAYPKSTKNKTNPTTANPAKTEQSGVVFKIQILSSKFPADSETEVAAARDYGEVSSEWFENKKVYRHLLGDFYDRTIALDVLRKVKNGGYPQAFLVKYVNGKRQ
jgi:hypothetical protein